MLSKNMRALYAQTRCPNQCLISLSAESEKNFHTNFYNRSTGCLLAEIPKRLVAVHCLETSAHITISSPDTTHGLGVSADIHDFVG